MPAGQAAVSAAHVVPPPQVLADVRAGQEVAGLVGRVGAALSGKGLQTFEHQKSIEDSADRNLARAIEMIELRDIRRAEAIMRCGLPRYPGGPSWRCRRKLCPECDRRLASRFASTVERDIMSMCTASLTLFFIRSRGLDDVGRTLRIFREALGRLRRRKAFALTLRKGTGVLETMLTDDMHAFLVHAHLVLAGRLIDDEVLRLDAAWCALIGCRSGGVGLNPDRPYVDTKDCGALARYISKSSTWCPKPGSLEPRALEALKAGLHGKQLLVRWGLGGRGYTKRGQASAHAR